MCAYEDVVDWIEENWDPDLFDTFDDMLNTLDASWLQDNRLPVSEILPNDYIAELNDWYVASVEGYD